MTLPHGRCGVRWRFAPDIPSLSLYTGHRQQTAVGTVCAWLTQMNSSQCWRWVSWAVWNMPCHGSRSSCGQWGRAERTGGRTSVPLLPVQPLLRGSGAGCLRTHAHAPHARYACKTGRGAGAAANRNNKLPLGKTARLAGGDCGRRKTLPPGAATFLAGVAATPAILVATDAASGARQHAGGASADGGSIRYRIHTPSTLLRERMAALRRIPVGLVAGGCMPVDDAICSWRHG